MSFSALTLGPVMIFPKNDLRLLLPGSPVFFHAEILSMEAGGMWVLSEGLQIFLENLAPEAKEELQRQSKELVFFLPSESLFVAVGAVALPEAPTPIHRDLASQDG